MKIQNEYDWNINRKLPVPHSGTGVYGYHNQLFRQKHFALGAVLNTANNSDYFWAFVIAGFSYLVIPGFVHLLMPKMTPLDDNLNYIH